MMEVLLRPWRHYADFSGRSSRTEYFLFLIAYIVALFVIAFLFVGYSAFVDQTYEPGGEMVFAILAIMLVGLVPGLAVAVRRMHDQNKSGWLVLVYFVPYVGGLIFLVLCFLPGTKGENDYGWDPRRDAPQRTAEIFS
jgi:uncharacterized membrane protein YhaH (DUF805 family)